MPELRIALFTHSVNPRGGVVHTLELGRALHELGHDVTVFAPAQPGQNFFRHVPHHVGLVPVGPAPASLADLVGDRIDAFVRHLTPLLQRESFDVLHTHDGIGGNALATLAERGAIDGFVRTVHHLDPFDDERLAAWQDRAVLAARQVLCVSPLWCDTLRRSHGIEAALVANGVDLGRFGRHGDASDAAVVARLGLRPGAPLVLAVGGIEERKNTLRLLQAFIDLRGTHPTAQLVIAGGASLLDHSASAREFAAQLQSSGLGTDAVRVTGALPDAEMPALFRAADVLAMPSLREGFGLVVLEALACGTPVLVSRIAPFTDYLADSVAAGHAVFADPLDPASIAAGLRRAIEPGRAEALARATPPVCLQHSWRASALRHVALYKAQRALARAA